jgi:hypothetical protein
LTRAPQKRNYDNKSNDAERITLEGLNNALQRIQKDGVGVRIPKNEVIDRLSPIRQAAALTLKTAFFDLRKAKAAAVAAARENADGAAAGAAAGAAGTGSADDAAAGEGAMGGVDAGSRVVFLHAAPGADAPGVVASGVVEDVIDGVAELKVRFVSSDCGDLRVPGNNSSGLKTWSAVLSAMCAKPSSSVRVFVREDACTVVPSDQVRESCGAAALRPAARLTQIIIRDCAGRALAFCRGYAGVPGGGAQGHSEDDTRQGSQEEAQEGSAVESALPCGGAWAGGGR